MQKKSENKSLADSIIDYLEEIGAGRPDKIYLTSLVKAQDIGKAPVFVAFMPRLSASKNWQILQKTKNDELDHSLEVIYRDFFEKTPNETMRVYTDFTPRHS